MEVEKDISDDIQVIQKSFLLETEKIKLKLPKSLSNVEDQKLHVKYYTDAVFEPEIYGKTCLKQILNIKSKNNPKQILKIQSLKYKYDRLQLNFEFLKEEIKNHSKILNNMGIISINKA